MTHRIPLSLERPLLRDAIVEFRFTPKVSPELLPGIFYDRLKESWSPPYKTSSSAITLGYQLTASARQLPYFTREGYRLHVLEDRAYFNISDQYIGWSKSYLPILNEACPKILDSDILSLSRVSLRFINDLPNTDVFELIKSFAPPSISDVEPLSQSVRYTVKRGDVNVILNLASNVSDPNNNGSVSVIDIDLQHALSGNIEQALKLVTVLHDMNKEILFGELIPAAFLADFGPKYD